MTDAALAGERMTIAPRPGAGLPGLARLALRDLRGAIGGFWVFLACLALGVAAIASVGTIADAVRGGLDSQGRVLLGGDIAVSRMHVRASDAERQWLVGRGAVSEIASLRAMARKPGASGSKSALVEIKAVDAAYPLTGALTTTTGGDAKALLAHGATALVDPLLAERLGLAIGDTLMLGDGRVVAWGRNDLGQLGAGDLEPRHAPAVVPLPDVAVGISVGDSHVAVLLADGRVMTWGAGGDGQLGGVSMARRTEPGLVEGLPPIRAIAAGNLHTLALDAQGQVWAWGRNRNGQLGDGTTLGSLRPRLVPGLNLN